MTASCQGASFTQEPHARRPGFRKALAIGTEATSQGGPSAGRSGTPFPAHGKLHEGRFGTQMLAPSSVGLQLALLSLSGGYEDVALSIPQGSFLPPFLHSSSILHSDWPTITSLFPHLLGNRICPLRPSLLPQFLLLQNDRQYFPGWVFLPSSSQLAIVLSTCCPRALSGLCPDFIGHADLCGASPSLSRLPC